MKSLLDDRVSSDPKLKKHNSFFTTGLDVTLSELISLTAESLGISEERKQHFPACFTTFFVCTDFIVSLFEVGHKTAENQRCRFVDTAVSFFLDWVLGLVLWCKKPPN